MLIDLFAALRNNIVLVTALSSWVVAQILKCITAYYKHSEFKKERLVGAGGMPSSHTSLVVSLATAVGMQDGWNSALFALAFILAAIVMYDAAGVRQAAGKQAKVINKLMREIRAEHTIRDDRLKELLGHTPLEVLAGALLGVVMACLFRRFY